MSDPRSRLVQQADNIVLPPPDQPGDPSLGDQLELAIRNAPPSKFMQRLFAMLGPPPPDAPPGPPGDDGGVETPEESVASGGASSSDGLTGENGKWRGVLRIPRQKKTDQHLQQDYQRMSIDSQYVVYGCACGGTFRFDTGGEYNERQLAQTRNNHEEKKKQHKDWLANGGTTTAAAPAQAALSSRGAQAAPTPLAPVRSNQPVAKLQIDPAPHSEQPNLSQVSEDYRVEECCICLSPPPRDARLRLWCNHLMCIPCASAASKTNFNACPICRIPHVLDVETLRRQQSTFKAQYRAWRKGHVRGAKGELSDTTGYPGWRIGTKISFALDPDAHSSQAGILALRWPAEPSSAKCASPGTGKSALRLSQAPKQSAAFKQSADAKGASILLEEAPLEAEALGSIQLKHLGGGQSLIKADQLGLSPMLEQSSAKQAVAVQTHKVPALQFTEDFYGSQIVVHISEQSHVHGEFCPAGGANGASARASVSGQASKSLPLSRLSITGCWQYENMPGGNLHGTFFMTEHLDGSGEFRGWWSDDGQDVKRAWRWIPSARTCEVRHQLAFVTDSFKRGSFAQYNKATAWLCVFQSAATLFWSIVVVDSVLVNLLFNMVYVGCGLRITSTHIPQAACVPTALSVTVVTRSNMWRRVNIMNKRTLQDDASFWQSCGTLSSALGWYTFGYLLLVLYCMLILVARNHLPMSMTVIHTFYTTASCAFVCGSAIWMYDVRLSGARSKANRCKGCCNTSGWSFMAASFFLAGSFAFAVDSVFKSTMLFVDDDWLVVTGNVSFFAGRCFIACTSIPIASINRRILGTCMKRFGHYTTLRSTTTQVEVEDRFEAVHIMT